MKLLEILRCNEGYACFNTRCSSEYRLPSSAQGLAKVRFENDVIHVNNCMLNLDLLVRLGANLHAFECKRLRPVFLPWVPEPQEKIFFEALVPRVLFSFSIHVLVHRNPKFTKVLISTLTATRSP